MPKSSKATASETAELQGFEGHYEELEGGYTVGFETYTEDADMTPLFKGLPDDSSTPARNSSSSVRPPSSARR